MTANCPHCQTRIEIDPPTLAALAGRSTFNCPACQGAVVVPGHMPSLASAQRGSNRNFLILGAAALLVLGGLGFFLASRKSGETNTTTQNIRNEILNNSYFTQLIAAGITTKADLEAIGDIRPYGGGFIGISRDALRWEDARHLAKKTGSEILPMDNPDPVHLRDLSLWLEKSFASYLSPAPWVVKNREAAVFAHSEIIRSAESGREANAFLIWRAYKGRSPDVVAKNLMYRNKSRAELDEDIRFTEGTLAMLWPYDLVFKGLTPKVSVILDQKPFPIYESLWGKPEVFSIHPPSLDNPGTVDFSAITAKSAGTLIINIRDDPRGDCRVEIFKGADKVVDSKVLDTDTWQVLKIPFDEENVILNIHATGWSCEYAFMTYEFDQ